MFESILMQVAANATTAAATSTSDTWTGFIVAIATLVSTMSGLIVHYIDSPKIKQVGSLAKSSADKLIESKQDIATLAKVTYAMLPAEAAKITDAQNVRLAALEAKLDAANQELSKLKTGTPG
jgi:hypothetical protein